MYRKYPQNFQPTPTLPTTHTHNLQKNPHPHPQFFLPTQIYPHPHPQISLLFRTHTHKFIYTHNRHTTSNAIAQQLGAHWVSDGLIESTVRRV